MIFEMTESLLSALRSIRAHSLRSFLTTLGIIIGVASVITMVGLIQGFSYMLNQEFQGLGSNSFSVQSYTSMEDRLQGKIARITPDDVELIQSRMSDVVSLSPIMYNSNGALAQVRYQSQISRGQIMGTDRTYQEVGQVYLKYGRFLGDGDNLTRRKVAVIGEDVRSDLSLPENPVGEFIRLGSEWVRIVGIAEPKGQIFGQSQDNFVLIPFSTMQSLMGNQTRPDIFLQVSLFDGVEQQAINQRITNLLRFSHGLEGDDPNDFRVQTSEQLTDSFNNILDTITLVMGGVVGISLLVGGIGIMNIMLVSVTERTREIGICKAIGAKRHQILLQFLLEALILCLLGGLAGLTIGYSLSVLLSTLIPGFPSAYVPMWAILLSFGFSAGVGLIFGIAPAAKAANLDPIQALRYE
jgi:putative ABC transport system permease protein